MIIENQLTEEQRLAIIGKIVKAVQSGENTLSPKVKSFIDEVKSEQAAEEMVVKHGLLDAQNEDMEYEEEFLLVDSAEKEDEEDESFDIDFLVKDSKASRSEDVEFDLDAELKDIFKEKVSAE